MVFEVVVRVLYRCSS